LYAIIPSLLIVFLNLKLIDEMRKSKRKISFNNTEQQTVRMKAEMRTMIRTQMIFSFIFIVVTWPRAISYGIFVKTPTRLNQILNVIFELISQVYFNSALLILLTQNKPFREQFNEIVLKRTRIIYEDYQSKVVTILVERKRS
jgi:hypothetical protein